MSQVLRQLPATKDRRVLVGSNTADDAGVFRLDRDRALVQTLDFFTPIVDDPRVYGEIAAANALSDVYAMGGRPLTALNVMGIPPDRVPARVIAAILKGGQAKVREAKCALVGGHTIRNPEPVYGLSVTGLVSPKRMITNASARPGDLLVLTKPLGTGIITTGIKRGLTSPALARRAVTCMRRLNTPGPDLAEAGLVRAGTDVTGFGLLGHLGALCRASGVGAELSVAAVPCLAPAVWDLIRKDCVPGGTLENLRNAGDWTDFGGATQAENILLADAQTSGGLLLCVPPRHWPAARAMLKRHRTLSEAIIGRVTRSRKGWIRVNP